MKRMFGCVSVFLLLAVPLTLEASENCANTSVGLLPLNDLGPGLYLGQFQGGLYPYGSNELPVPHKRVGIQRARTLPLLGPNGQPSPTGVVVLLSIGMSNTTQEFCSQQDSTYNCNSWTFMGQAAVDSRVNHTTLVIANGAKGGQTPPSWDSPTDANYDRVRDYVLAPRGLTEAQVQVVWIKEANASPKVSLPQPNADAYALETGLGNVLRAAKTRYPNLSLAFLSNRIYAGYATTALNPEPYAYESGFAVKYLVEAQIHQMESGGTDIDPKAGDLNFNTAAPWIAWGPNLWADGLVPRSDGLTWKCSDLEETDGTHPAQSGEQKVGTMLLRFMKTSPFAAPWFVAPCGPGPDADGDGVADACDACPNTLAGVPVDVVGCPNFIPGDLDHTGSVDASDLQSFVGCVTGPQIQGVQTGCADADLDGDGDIDQDDFGIFQRCYSGSGNPTDPNCAN